MAEPLAKPRTVEDFLDWGAQQPERYEYTGRHDRDDGRRQRRARDHSRTPAHDIAPRDRAAARCRAFSQELKVTMATRLHYPDLAVTCVPVEPREDRLREPAVIVEVLSPSTADRDRGTKWLA